jgi:hypothetical protein
MVISSIRRLSGGLRLFTTQEATMALAMITRLQLTV